MGEKVEFQGTVVETADQAPTSGGDAVIQHGQGLVFRTEGNRFGTLGADGFYHGYVPSTQVRDILMGAGDAVEDEPATAMDLAIDKAKEQGSEPVAGSEAPFPTGDVDNQTDAVVGPNIASTDRDETLTPLSSKEASKMSTQPQTDSATTAPKGAKA